MVYPERLYLLSSGTQVDFFPEQWGPRLAPSVSLLPTSTGPDLHVRWAHTPPDRGGSTKHFTGGSSNSDLCPWARHWRLVERLMQCVYIHIATGTKLWHIKAVSENICNNEMHHCCWRKIKWKAVQCVAGWGWLMTLMLVAADQEIKCRAVHHHHGRWGRMSQRQSSEYQKPSLLSQNPEKNPTACIKKPSLFQCIVKFIRSPLK